MYTHKKTENHIKTILFSYRKMFWGRQTGWKTRPGSAGSDNSVHWSCKRWVTAKVVQNGSNFIENQENEGFKILDPGNPKFSRRRPMPAFSLVGFRQETAPKPSNNSKKCGVLAQRPGLTQKLKVPKWVCRSPLAVGEAAQPFFAIFGPARGQIYEKRPKKYKKCWF